jgi:hypothetical protein
MKSKKKHLSECFRDPFILLFLTPGECLVINIGLNLNKLYFRKNILLG